MNQLSPYYISGFTDGEGCFSLFLNTEKRKRKAGFISVYRYWITTFSFTLRIDDMEILNNIRDYFGCGVAYLLKGKNAHAFYLVRSRKELVSAIIPHFDKYPLQAKKNRDFILWKEAVLILTNSDKNRVKIGDKQSFSKIEEERLIEIRKLLRKRLSGAHLKDSENNDFKKHGKQIIN